MFHSRTMSSLTLELLNGCIDSGPLSHLWGWYVPGPQQRLSTRTDPVFYNPEQVPQIPTHLELVILNPDWSQKSRMNLENLSITSKLKIHARTIQSEYKWVEELGQLFFKEPYRLFQCLAKNLWMSKHHLVTAWIFSLMYQGQFHGLPKSISRFQCFPQCIVINFLLTGLSPLLVL